MATTRARALSGKAARRVWASSAAAAGVWAPSSTTRGAWLPLWEAAVCITCRSPAEVKLPVVLQQACQLREARPAVWRLQCGVLHSASGRQLGLLHTIKDPHSTLEHCDRLCMAARQP